MIDKEKMLIIKTLKEQGYANKYIDYSEIVKLHEIHAKAITLDDFVELLGIARTRFRAIRLNGGRTKILEQKATEDLKEKIKSDLRIDGYANKKISYSEFLQLYEKYKNMIAEREFANIIGITDDRYKAIKNRGGRTAILATQIDEQKIVLEIKQKQHDDMINYNEFVSLYEPYKAQINDELKFAEIIGMPRASYYSMKNRGLRAHIFCMEIPQEVIDGITRGIIEQGYENNEINYNEFLSLYSQYCDKVSERQFANILGISESTYGNIKHKNSKTKILELKTEITPELKKEIREKIVLKGYSNTSIDYETFKNLYNEVVEGISERQFAEILGISYFSYGVMKNKGTRAVILKTEKCIDLLQYYHDIGLPKEEAIKRASEELGIDAKTMLKKMNEVSTIREEKSLEK